MTVVTDASFLPCADALSNEVRHWHAHKWGRMVRNVRRLQVRIVKAMQCGKILTLCCCVLDERAFEMLEPCAVKVACTVLRGGGRSNPVSLPDLLLSIREESTENTIHLQFSHS